MDVMGDKISLARIAFLGVKFIVARKEQMGVIPSLARIMLYLTCASGTFITHLGNITCAQVFSGTPAPWKSG